MEIITINKFEFLPEVWEIIKQYLGIRGGININFAKSLLKINTNKLQTSFHFAFRFNNINNDCFNYFVDFAGSAITKRKNMMKIFYKNLHKMNDTITTTNEIVKMADSEKFKTPNDLEIGEWVFIFKKDRPDFPDRKVGKVYSKTKCQFVVHIRKRIGDCVYDEYINVRNNKFIRHKHINDARKYLFHNHEQVNGI